MDNEMYCTSALIIQEPEVEEYTWNFHVSPKNVIEKHLETVRFDRLEFSGLQFKTGLLSQIEHKWNVTFYSNQINVQMSLQQRKGNEHYSIKPSLLELISEEEVKARHTITLHQDSTLISAVPSTLWVSYWGNSDNSWDDTVDTVRITFRICREFNGTCIRNLISEEAAARLKSVLAASKNVNCSDFFLSTHLSDVTFQCKGETFPGHKLLLSSRSPVFKQMFRTEMEEHKKGLVVINDMEPDILHLLLKFMYCGHLDMVGLSDSKCNELFQAADRYNLEGLKILCEHELLLKITEENCLEFHETAELYNVALLKQKCWDMMRKNTWKVFGDSQTFKVFSEKYPDLAFKLFVSTQ